MIFGWGWKANYRYTSAEPDKIGYNFWPSLKVKNDACKVERTSGMRIYRSGEGEDTKATFATNTCVGNAAGKLSTAIRSLAVNNL